MLVAVGRDCCDLGDFTGRCDATLVGLKEVYDGIDGGLGPPTEVVGGTACSDVFDAFGEDRAGEDSGCCGAVSSDFVGLVCYILDQSSQVRTQSTEPEGIRR